MPFGIAPRNGLMPPGHPLSTLARGRSQAVVVKRGRQEGSNLAEYCKGSPDVAEHDRVMANWKGYGTYYPGEVGAKNDDGSIDVQYDDGWTEPHVAKGEFEPAAAAAAGKEAKKRDDAACDLAEDVSDIKEKLKNAEQNIAVYLSSQRAASNANEPSPAPMATEAAASVPSTPAAAPSPAADELQKVKDEIDAVDGEIASTKAKLKSNANVMKDLSGQALPANGTSQPKTVDQLLAEYKARLAKRKEVLKNLQDQLRQQEQQMAAMGAASISLEDIQSNVKDMTSDMEDIKAKRDKLEKEDRLDSELRAAVDSMLAYSGKLQDRIQALFDARSKAEAAKKAAEAAKKEAEAARKVAEAEAARKAAEAKAAMQAAKTAQEKAEAAKKAAEAEKARKLAQAAAAKKAAEAQVAAERAAEDAEKNAFKAGEEVENELKMVSKETETLDSGVHPNGDKWWRYRYEHSFVEAAMMIFISALMLLYEKLFNWLRHEVYYAKAPKRTNEALHGTMYTVWLEFASLQMLACLVVFLTIWLLDHCHVFDIVARHVHGGEFMRLPVAGPQYRHLAFDICVCLIMSLLFYFILMFSVVHASMHKLQTWAESESSEPEEDLSDEDDEESLPSGSRSVDKRFSVQLSQTAHKMAQTAKKMKRAMTFFSTADEFKQRKNYFLLTMTSHPIVVQQLRQRSKEGGHQMSSKMIIARFPFWKYLRANVRSTMDSFLELGTPLWLGVIVTFMVLLVLHHALHIGYIRVMAFFLVVQCATLGLSMYMIHRVNSTVEGELKNSSSEVDDETGMLQTPAPTHVEKVDKSMAFAYCIKQVTLFMLQYTLFFLCYGVARSICQPWMWKLHFWLVLGISAASIGLTVIFICYISPLMTVFAASMAMPPYIDPNNVAKMQEMIDALRSDTMSPAEFASMG